MCLLLWLLRVVVIVRVEIPRRPWILSLSRVCAPDEARRRTPYARMMLGAGRSCSCSSSKSPFPP